MAESEWNVCRLSRSKHEIKKRLYGADTASHGHMRNPVREKIIFRQNHLPLKIHFSRQETIFLFASGMSLSG